MISGFVLVLAAPAFIRRAYNVDESTTTSRTRQQNSRRPDRGTWDAVGIIYIDDLVGFDILWNIYQQHDVNASHIRSACTLGSDC